MPHWKLFQCGTFVCSKLWNECPHEVHEEGVGMEDGGGVFGMELGADEPGVVGEFDDFDEVGVGIGADALHAVLLEVGEVAVVEFVAVAVALLDGGLAVDGVGLAAFAQLAGVGSEAHSAAHAGDGLLLFHEVDDGVLCVGCHLCAVGIGVAERVAGKFDDHHLHAEADAEGGDVVGAGVLDGGDFAFGASLSETGADDGSCHAAEFFFHVIGGDVFAAHEVGFHLHAAVDAGEVEAFADGFVGVLQVVLADECHVYFAGGSVLFVEKVVPWLHGWCLAYRNAYFAEDGGIESLALHVDGHFVDAGHVFALHHTLEVNIAEGGNFHAQGVVEVAFGAENKDVGLYAHALQFFDGVLGGFGFQFVGCFQIGHVGEMHTDGIAAELPAELPDGFHEGCAFDVADGAAHFGDDEVEGGPSPQPSPVMGRETVWMALPIMGEMSVRTEGVFFSQHSPFDFVGDVWDDLDGFAEIVAVTFAVDDGLVDAACGDGVVAGGLDVGEAFVVTEVEVGLHAIDGDVALAVFVGVEGAGVDVDVGVELLDGDFEATCLEQFADAGGDDAFAERGNDTACDEDVFGSHDC